MWPQARARKIAIALDIGLFFLGTGDMKNFTPAADVTHFLEGG